MRLSLRDIVVQTARRYPENIAVRSSGREISYGELDRLANQVAHALRELGVGPGDRIGIWVDKGIEAVAAMQGALRLGAAYVPVDPSSPASRAALILGDCQVRAVVSTRDRLAAEDVAAAVPHAGHLVVDGEPSDAGIAWADLAGRPAEPPAGVPDPADGDLAYILYTSGSTGKPKGVCISNLNALAFVRWAHDELGVQPTDRLSNHAPFHFDLSVLDLYAAFMAGAAVCIIPELMSYAPQQLVQFAREERITVWYSVPSALTLMMQTGGLLEADDLALRVICFAGEPFPIAHLRPLHARFWPAVRLLNLYGPTETNVCTFHEVRELSDDQVRPVPIGIPSCGDEAWAAKPDGTVAAVGEEGELIVSGPTVMLGYWGRAPQEGPYPTGDIVRVLEGGAFDYVGRRDHMVKIRGHRIELGEVEACLLAHPQVEAAAAVVVGSGLAAKLAAFVVPAGPKPPSLLSLKRHCSERVPRYMIVDSVQIVDDLPRTPNGKLDRRGLQALAAGDAPS